MFDVLNAVADEIDHVVLILGAFAEASEYLGPGLRAAIDLGYPVVVTGLFGRAVENILVEPGHEIAGAGVVAVEGGEFRGDDEAVGDLFKGHAAVQSVDPVAQSAEVRGTVEGGLVEAVGLACVAGDVEGDAGIGEVDAFDAVQRVRAGESAQVGQRGARVDVDTVVGAADVDTQGVDPVLPEIVGPRAVKTERVVAIRPEEGAGDSRVRAGCAAVYAVVAVVAAKAIGTVQPGQGQDVVGLERRFECVCLGVGHDGVVGCVFIDRYGDIAVERMAEPDGVADFVQQVFVAVVSGDRRAVVGGVFVVVEKDVGVGDAGSEVAGGVRFVIGVAVGRADAVVEVGIGEDDVGVFASGFHKVDSGQAGGVQENLTGCAYLSGIEGYRRVFVAVGVSVEVEGVGDGVVLRQLVVPGADCPQ